MTDLYRCVACPVAIHLDIKDNNTLLVLHMAIYT